MVKWTGISIAAAYLALPVVVFVRFRRHLPRLAVDFASRVRCFYFGERAINFRGRHGYANLLYYCERLSARAELRLC